MAKKLLPSRRGPGRSAQRVKPGDVIRSMFMVNPRGISIGDCHRYYTALKLKDWQDAEIKKLTGGDLEQRATQAHPRNPNKQAAFIARKTKAVDEIMARKRAPGTVTYTGFSRFFHYLLQLGYVKQETHRDHVSGKVTRVRESPKMRGADGEAILNAYTARAGGRQAKVQIEPPVIYVITDLGQSASDWNNPRKDLV